MHDDEATAAPLPDPLDRPVHPAPRRRPAGLLWATALAAVVIAVAASVAIRNPGTATGPASPPPGADVLGGATGGSAPRSTLNPLVAQGPSLVGRPAPLFELERLELDPAAGDAGGGVLRLADLRGTPVVVNLWAASCTPCLTEMPAFERVHRALGDKVRFVGVDVNDLEAEGRTMARRTGVTYPLVRDPSGAYLVAVGGAGLPTTLVLDASGTVVNARTGEWSEDELRAALAPLVG